MHHSAPAPSQAGLKFYVGAANLEGDGGYADKVLAEHARLQLVAAGRAVPLTRAAGDLRTVARRGAAGAGPRTRSPCFRSPEPAGPPVRYT